MTKQTPSKWIQTLNWIRWFFAVPPIGEKSLTERFDELEAEAARKKQIESK